MTGRFSKPNETAHKLVTHVRNKTYFRYNHKTGQEEITGHGTEIVREIMVTRECATDMAIKGFKPQVVVEKD
jgi:hypothetical protein